MPRGGPAGPGTASGTSGQPEDAPEEEGAEPGPGLAWLGRALGEHEEVLERVLGALPPRALGAAAHASPRWAAAAEPAFRALCQRHGWRLPRRWVPHTLARSPPDPLNALAALATGSGSVHRRAGWSALRRRAVPCLTTGALRLACQAAGRAGAAPMAGAVPARGVPVLLGGRGVPRAPQRQERPVSAVPRAIRGDRA